MRFRLFRNAAFLEGLRAAALVMAGQSVATALAGPVDLSPPLNSMGYADENGKFRMVQRFGDIKFSDGFSIPLRFEFWTGSDGFSSPSDYGWHGWRCGPLESKAELYGGERFLQVDLLCAKRMYLEKAENAGGLYVSPDGAWTATIENDLISVSRGDGWKLSFRGGLVDRLVTDSGLEIVWSRDAEGRVTAISEVDSENPSLVVGWNDVTPASVESLTAGDLAIAVELKDTGSAVLQYSSRFSWETPLGSTKTIGFDHGGDSLDVIETNGFIRRFKWEADTGHLLSDGMNRYEVAAADAPGELPLVSLTTPTGTTVSRRSNVAQGVAVVTDGEGRSWRVERVVEGAGFGAISRILSVEADSEALVMENQFDDSGRIASRRWKGDVYRSSRLSVPKPHFPSSDLQYFDEVVDMDGVEVLMKYQYDDAGRHVATTENGELVFEAEFDAEGRPISLASPGKFSFQMTYGDGRTFEKELTIPGVTDVPFGWIDANDDSIHPGLVVARRTDDVGNTIQKRFLDGSTATYRYEDGQLRGETLVARDGVTEIQHSEYIYSGDRSRILAIRENDQTGRTEYEEFRVGPNGGVLESTKVTKVIADQFFDK